MLSALTLLRAEENPQLRENWSYVLLAEELRRISALPKDDAPELFRRMSFNALISNTDDHPRKHAVIAMEKDWRLSPAYDLTPATKPNRSSIRWSKRSKTAGTRLPAARTFPRKTAKQSAAHSPMRGFGWICQKALQATCSSPLRGTRSRPLQVH